MNRREALKRLAVLTGGALSLSTVSGILGGCTANTAKFSPQTLSVKQNELVTQLTERIIPATDTPGAKAAKVNQFIDHMLTNWNTGEEREHFIEGLEHVSELCQKQHDERFVNLSNDAQIAIMEELQQEAKDNPYPKPNTDLRPFFHMLKEFTIVGYYTSEIGASEELNLGLIPGYYDGCIPYSNTDRSWA